MTNITEDHLDYHGTMENYALAKKKLFHYTLSNHKPTTFAVFPKDDAYGRAWFDDMPFENKLTYGVHNSAVIKADAIQQHTDGTDFVLNYLGEKYPFHTSLVGIFNVSNILAAVSVCVQMGVPMHSIVDSVR